MNPPIHKPRRNVSRRDGVEAPQPVAGLRYEERLDRDARWALAEGSRFFEEKSAVQDAMRRIAQRLDELGIPYAVGGGMAVFLHGFRRFTDELNPYVRDKYRELWTASRPVGKRYLRLWPAKGLPASGRSFGDLAAESPADAEILRAMQADGVTLDPEAAVVGDHVRLVTSDPGVARKYDMHDETEFWSDTA